MNKGEFIKQAEEFLGAILTDYGGEIVRMDMLDEDDYESGIEAFFTVDDCAWSMTFTPHNLTCGEEDALGIVIYEDITDVASEGLFWRILFFEALRRKRRGDE